MLKHKLNGTKKLDTQKRGPCNGDHQSQNDSGNWQNGVPTDAIVVLPRERGAEASHPQKLRALEPMLAWLTCAGAGSHLSVPQWAFGLAKARKRREMLYCDTMIGKRRPVLARAFSWICAKRSSSPATSPPRSECFDILSPPPGDSDVISQIDRLSSNETKIAPRSVRIAVGVFPSSAKLDAGRFSPCRCAK